jgi:phosphoenolpyruvate carboxykinase (ATP)
MTDYFKRAVLSTPAASSGRPTTPAADANSQARTEILKKNLRNKMVSNSVNKTALHPGGVEPSREHTELEETLHEHANIDYDRVAIVANPSVAALYEDALVCFESMPLTRHITY